MPWGRTPALGAVAMLALALWACEGGGPVEPVQSAQVEPVARPSVVRGIYVNAQVAGSSARLEELLSLADTTGLNTFVIDVKERGEVSYGSAVPLVAQAGAMRDYIEDLPALLRTLRERGIYPVARIVCFRDPVLAEARPDLAVLTSAGGPWLDPENDRPWVDPFNEEVWAYNIDLAREALDIGFAEIQWDYVRFPDVTDSVRAEQTYPARGGRTNTEGIEDFVAASRSALGDRAPITADVFGRVLTETGASNIGQEFEPLARVTDVLLPMVYPSLYTPNYFGRPDPSAEPYHTVRTALDTAVARHARTDGAIATIRPWLQAFTLGSTDYGPDQLLEQIRAVQDAGLSEYFFWHPDSRYPDGVF